ncbi:MAG: hypothetical protein WBD00_03385 [Candidatus Omnitrophota bacterium]
MKKRIFCGIVTIVFIVSMTVMALADTRSATYKQTLTGMGMPEMTMQVWMKDDMMRLDATPNGQLVTTIRRPDGLYNYVPSQNILSKMPKMDSKEEVKNPREFIEYLHGMGIKPVGVERVGEYECDVYKYKDTITGVPTTAWIWREKNFPIKIEAMTPFGKTTAVFSEVQINVPVSDKLFELPKDARFFDISDPWKGLQSTKKEQPRNTRQNEPSRNTRHNGPF